MIPITNSAKAALLSEYTSRPNKLWLAIAWTHFKGYFIEWKWQGAEFRSRMMFKFSPDEPFVPAKSYEDDIVPTLKFGKEISK
jgi:hypothetical protein